MKMTSPLANRISLFTMFIAVLAIIASTTFESITNYHLASEQAKEKMQVLAEVTAFNIASPSMFGDAEAASAVLNALNAESTVVSAYLLNANKQRLAQYQRTSRTEQEHLEQFTQVVQWQNKAVGELFFAFDSSGLQEQLFHQFRFSLVSTLIAVLVAGFLVQWMIRISTKPLRNLSEVAEKISRQSDYSLRAKIVSNHDDVSQLIHTFNTMLDHIEKQNSALHEQQSILHSSEHRLLLATASAELGIWDLDLRDNTLIWDDRMYEMYGIAREDICNNLETWTNSLHPHDKDQTMANYQAAIRGDKEFSSTFRIVNPDGKLKYMKASAATLRDSKGKALRMLGINSDVTESELLGKRAMEMLTDVQQVNAELSFQKHALDEHAIVSIADAHGGITYVNDNFCEISGYSRTELMGKNHSVLRSDEHSPEFIANMSETLAKGKTWRGEIKNLKKSGEHYWVAATIVPSLNETGEIVSWIGIRTDITKIKSTEEQLRRSQKMESIGELAGGIAHDFNNLLGIIIGNLDLIDYQVESDSKLQKRVQKAQNAALRGSSLTSRLLNFSRQSATDQSLVDIGKVIVDFEDLIRKSLTASISIKIHRSDQLWMVELNSDELEDALVNLALNARDAMSEGGQLLIEVKNTKLENHPRSLKNGLAPGEYVQLTISDTGIGMDSAITEKIFDPFFTTKNKGDGTGLGLAMVYGFVQRSHGHLSVTSEVGAGTTFSMYLPRASSADKISPKLGEAEALRPTGMETILIVDDEAELASVARSILDILGYTTICAQGGLEALQILETNRSIDLVFTDVVMPGGMSGLDLAEAIAMQYPAVGILLTSGFTAKANHSESAEKLIQKMIKKPYRDIELALRVRETLDEVK